MTIQAIEAGQASIDDENHATAHAADRGDLAGVQLGHVGNGEPMPTSLQVSETGIGGSARPYINRRKVAIALAPPESPPCFRTRQSWIEYVGDAATAQHMRRNDGPLRWSDAGPVEWNPMFRFCDDCPAVHQGRMLLAGKCDPQHLVKVAEVKA